MDAKTYKISLSPAGLDTTDIKAQQLLTQTQKETGRIPNMYANMANSAILLDTYLHGYKLFRREGSFTPAEQEVVFLSISYENNCEYCMAAHSAIADIQSKVPASVTDAIRNGEEISDAKLKALSEFTRKMVSKRGRVSEADAQGFLNAGYTEKHMLEIILAISVKTISNYANHLFEPEVDAMFKSRKWHGTPAKAQNQS